MEVEPHNATSDMVRTKAPLLSDREFVKGAARELFTDDFVRVDRRSLIALPTADAGAFLDGFDAWFDVGDGRPNFVVEAVVAVRGQRLALIRLHIGYAGGQVAGSHLVLCQFDGSIDRLEKVVAFDLEDVDPAIVELDRMNAELDADPTE